MSGADLRIAYQGASQLGRANLEGGIDASKHPGGDYKNGVKVGESTVFVTDAGLEKLKSLQQYEDGVTMAVMPDPGYLERFLLGDRHQEDPETIGRGTLAGLEPPTSKGAGLRRK
jgi:hypothetical protein